ncbi:MAG: ABC transporter permease [Candidatus Pacebacteria bacterium]|nr:ABC transporter permease [Candidatus Paceibacterota bacterium]
MTNESLALVQVIITTLIISGTPLVLIGLGVMVAEQSGVINLGVEGMATVGALVAVIMVLHDSNPTLALLAAALAAAMVAGVFALVSVVWRGNQIVTGLAVSLLCLGFTSWLGQPYQSATLSLPRPSEIPFLAEIPLVGTIIFAQPPLVYWSLAMALMVGWSLNNHRLGWLIRACGQSPQSLYALGHSPQWIKTAAVVFGGAMAGLGGGFVSLYSSGIWHAIPLAGKGWIALALGGLAGIKPLRLVVFAYGFGAVVAGQLALQASGSGFGLSPHLLLALPYLAIILVLLLWSRRFKS